MRLLVIVIASLALSACATLESLTGPLGPAPDSTAPDATTTTTTVSTSSSSAPLQTPEQQLLEAERRVAAMAQERGLGGALASVIDPADGFVVRPGALYQGADAVSRGLPTSTTGPVFWQPDRAFVANSNDMGMTSGRFVQVVPGAEALQGRYVIVWRKDPTGEWRALSETRVQDPPSARARR